MIQAEDPLLTVKELAAELRCSKPHVYKAIRGEIVGVSRLPSISMGRKRLVRRSSLEKWKRENESQRCSDIMPASPKLTPLTHGKGEFHA